MSIEVKVEGEFMDALQGGIVMACSGPWEQESMEAAYSEAMQAPRTILIFEWTWAQKEMAGGLRYRVAGGWRRRGGASGLPLA
jgi:hypothetical protein